LLGVSPGTVAAQFASAKRKLGVRTRQELVALFSGAASSAAETGKPPL
jgi:DNA-binding CsgD family transcriptional regulator